VEDGVSDEDRFAVICDIPTALRAGGHSLRDVVDASGYAALRGEFAARELAAYLRDRPAVVESWVAYSEDKRTSEGWYLRPPNAVGRVVLSPPPVREQRYPDLAAACAAFIIAELGDVLGRAPAV
jgi:hypothetical protein